MKYFYVLTESFIELVACFSTGTRRNILMTISSSLSKKLKNYEERFSSMKEG